MSAQAPSLRRVPHMPQPRVPVNRPHMSVPLPVVDKLLSVHRSQALPVGTHHTWNRQDHDEDQQHDRQL